MIILEDDPDTSVLLKAAFARTGYLVTCFVKIEDYKSYLMILNETEPDIVISDINLPNINGLNLCRFLKASERFSSVPVVLISAMDVAPSEIAASCAACFIKKPIDMVYLQKIVSNLTRDKTNKCYNSQDA